MNSWIWLYYFHEPLESLNWEVECLIFLPIFAEKSEPDGGDIRVLETRYDFDAKSRLASAKFDYQYTHDLINPTLKGRVGGKSLPLYFVHHGWSTKISQKSTKNGQFVVHPHNLNVTSVTDGVATFTFGANFDVLMVQGKDFAFCFRISNYHFGT